MEKLNQLQKEALSVAAKIGMIKCCDTEMTKDLRLKYIAELSQSLTNIFKLSAEISNLQIEVIETTKNNY